MNENAGSIAYERIKDLFPICRSITGNGVRQTLNYIKDILPNLQIHETPSYTKVFDWEIPEEWNIEGASITYEDGTNILDFSDHNLHVVNYAEPVDKILSLEELQGHLYSLPEQPDAIPYVTSYYKRRWGFCLSDNQRKSLKPGNYHVKIDSQLTKGALTYADLLIKGKSKQEILLSTYVCHPSMANNELSGPVVTTALTEYLQSIEKNLHYSYRIVFVPETIGTIAYLHKNIKTMKNNMVAGYVITCVGDNRTYSFMPSTWEDSYADHLSLHILNRHVESYQTYSFLQRGSDERQYCSPNIGLPVVSVMRSKYHEYPEYHTSLDNLDLVSPEGSQGAYDVLLKCLKALELNHYYRTTVTCEPMLSRRNLYANIGRGNSVTHKLLFDLLAFCDGKHDLLSIAEKMDKSILELEDALKIALNEQLVEKL